jgi:hypothetical protein
VKMLTSKSIVATRIIRLSNSIYPPCRDASCTATSYQKFFCLNSAFPNRTRLRQVVAFGYIKHQVIIAAVVHV